MQPLRLVVAADLARHFLAARDAERAVSYALQAGREASSRYAHAEARRWYQQSVDMLLEAANTVENGTVARTYGFSAGALAVSRRVRWFLPGD
jgi:hypothetical protein